jgi:hypothetical protein
MAFILLFVVLALAIPLSLEMYKRGNNNLLTRSLKDVRELVPSLPIGKTVSGVATDFKSFGFVIVTVAVVLLVLKLVYAILSLIFDWIF